MGFRLLRHNSNEVFSNLPDFVMPLVPTGTGGAVSTFQLTVSTTTTVSIDGNGMLFDDAAGTVNPQTVKTVASGGSRSVFIRLTSGTASLRVIGGMLLLTHINGYVTMTNSPAIGALDLNRLPSVMTFFNCTGSNTITGNLSSLPSVMTSFVCTGSNAITGNLSSLPSVMTYFFCIGLNTITDYTSPRTWATNYNYFLIRQAVGSGLSSTEVDNLLIDMSAATWGGSSRTLDVRGVNAARTSASNAAVATLLSKSVNVLTN